MHQRLKDTDAAILMEFDRAIAPLRDLPKGPERTRKKLEVTRPFYERLRANGHEPADAIALLMAVHKEI